MDSAFDHILTFNSQTPLETEAFAQKLCEIPKGLQAGDLVALVGAIGMGKSVFARSVVRILSGDPALDVPSPTFTLVQGYQSVDARSKQDENPLDDIMHCDLYRLKPGDPLDDLLLDERQESSLILVEWPDRLPAYLLEKALVLRFTARDDFLGNFAVPSSTGFSRRIELYGNTEWRHRLKKYIDSPDNRKEI